MSSFNVTKNSENYNVDDFVIIRNGVKYEIAQIKEIKKGAIGGFKVKKYIFANYLKRVFQELNEEYDPTYEVVEDSVNLYDISYEQIMKKCNTLPANDESLSNFSKYSNYFFCRFATRGEQLFPISYNLTESSPTKTNIPIKEFMIVAENTPIMEKTTPIERNIDKTSSFNPQRNSVKRNLNKSFEHSPKSTEKSILNYSVIDISDDEENKNVVLKLRRSQKRINNTHDNEVNNYTSPPKIKKSTRNIPRKSYADYISPKKHEISPNKRKCYNSTQSSDDEDFIYADENSRSTPRKLSRSARSTPTVRRSLRLSSVDKESPNVNEVNKKKTNLNESLRKNILKTTLKEKEPNIDDLNESFKTKELRINLEKMDLSNEMDDDTIRNSPRSTRNKISTPKSSNKVSKTPKTPKNRSKLIKEGIITPSMQERCTKIADNSTPLMKARNNLHVSFVPDVLPCREKEYNDVYNFVRIKLLDKCGGCMYVSGVPGTGKTATVSCVIKNLQKSSGVPKFQYVNVNGMKLSEPRQCYVEILKQLTGKSLSWEQAQNTLEEMFMKQKKMTPTVILIDELDILCTKRQDVIYNLLDWPTKVKNQLIIITIANTMDLPERLLMSRVASRLGLTRLTFQPYSYKQLQEIVTKRLCTNVFNSDAVQLVARKVASVSGDARRALDICRRAAEIAESKGSPEGFVTVSEVDEALRAMFTQPKVLAIKSCSKLERLLLQSIVAEVERTGVEETTFEDVYKMLTTFTGIEGMQKVSSTIAQRALSKLSACRLILADQKCSNIHQKIILNVSSDDIYYALKN